MIKLYNDFHNTKINVKIHAKGRSIVEISKETYNKIKDSLCGADSCECGIIRGSDNTWQIEKRFNHSDCKISYYLVKKSTY